MVWWIKIKIYGQVEIGGRGQRNYNVAFIAGFRLKVPGEGSESTRRSSSTRFNYVPMKDYWR